MPEVHGHIAFPRNLAMGNDLTHAFSAILHFGLSCGNERYFVWLLQDRDFAYDPVGSFSMREMA